jgi:hypothetical protein
MATLGDLVATSHGLVFLPFAHISLPEASVLDVGVLYGVLGSAVSQFMKKRDFRKAFEDARQNAVPLRGAEVSLSPLRAAALRENAWALNRSQVGAIGSEPGSETLSIASGESLFSFVHAEAEAIAKRLSEWKTEAKGAPLSTASRTDRPQTGKWDGILETLAGEGKLAAAETEQLNGIAGQPKRMQSFRHAILKTNRVEQIAVRRRLERVAPAVRAACLETARHELKRVPLRVLLAIILISLFPAVLLFHKALQPLAEKGWDLLVGIVPSITVLIGIGLLIASLGSLPRLRREVRDLEETA